MSYRFLPKDDQNGASLLQIHLDAIESGSGSLEGDLPPLKLGPRHLRPVSKFTLPSLPMTTAWLAMAASVAFLVFLTPREHDELTPKGATSIRVVVQSNGYPREFVRGEVLKEGDAVNAEITPSSDSFVVRLIMNHQGEWLTDPGKAVVDGFLIHKGHSRHFKSAIELVGDAEGETMMIFVCEMSTNDSLESLRFALSNALSSSEGLSKKLPANCSINSFILRRSK